jgi:hypothetical protein
VYPEDGSGEEDDSGTSGGYSAPQYYFEVRIGSCTARSGLLKYQDYIEIELKDENDEPIGEAEYALHLSDGSVRKGELNQQGTAKEHKMPPGRCEVRFPSLSS